MLKICILMQEIQTLGGVQRVVTTMMNKLAKNENYDITIIAPVGQARKNFYTVHEAIRVLDESNFKKKDNIFVRLFKKINRASNVFNMFKITNIIDKIYFSDKAIQMYKRYMIENKINVIIGIGADYSILAAKIAKRIKNLKCIAWMHSTYEGYFKVKNRTTSGLQNVLDKYADEIDELLVLTNKDRLDFSRKLKNLKKEPIVLYNPVTIDAKKRSALNRERILFVGRLVNSLKGVDLLIQIMERVAQQVPDCILEIVGDGKDRKIIEGMIKEKQLDNKVIMYGASDCVERYYEKAAVLCVTSRFEGFGLVITEALAHGVPVVAFHAHGPDEIIIDSKCGYLVEQYDIIDFSNKVVELLLHPEKLKEFSDNALERSKDFDLDTVLKRFTKIIEEGIRV